MTFDETLHICNEFVYTSLLPTLDTIEATMVDAADDMGECASPHFSMFVALVWELMERGWTIDELVNTIKDNGESILKEINESRKGIN